MSIRRPQGGYILLSVVVVVSLLAATALLITGESALDSNTAAGEFEAQQVRYVAAAGMAHAEWLAQSGSCGGDFSLASTSLGGGNYNATVTSPMTNRNTYDLAPVRDSWLKQSSPTSNQGGDVELSVKAAAGDDMRALYRFNLGGIPAGARIASATAWFYVTAHDDEGAVDIHTVTSAWAESAANWNNSAHLYDSQIAASIPAQNNSDSWVKVNLTTLTQRWVNGLVNHGIMLKAASDGVESKYSSREWSDSNLRPRLEIVTATDTTSLATIDAFGNLANGLTHDSSRSAVELYQQTSNLVWQFNEGLDDAFIRGGGSSDENFGASPILNLKSDRNILVRFQPQALPPGARVVKARLGLYLEAGNGVDDGNIDLHALSRDWVEGVENGDEPGFNQGVTYDAYNGASAWSTAGGDYDPAVIDSVNLESMETGWYHWDVTSQVEAWRSGATNHGLLLREGSGDAGDIDFVSSDNSATPEYRPRLELTLICDCGIACTIPQGSGKIVIIGNWSGLSPNPRDRAKAAIFEAWGYQVVHRDDSFIFLINFSNYDIVFVSATVNGFSVGGQLTNRAIGIVNEERDLTDELGFASNVSNPVGDTLEVIDNTHFITQPFALGTLPIFDANMEQLSISGTTAAGLASLASAGGADSLVLLDQGAMMVNGGTVAGRRVNLPFGYASGGGLNWDYLNSNGLLLVQRALEWAKSEVAFDALLTLSTDSDAELGGLSFTDVDLAQYNPGAATAGLFFDGGATTLNADIDAFHQLANGHLVLSTSAGATLGGVSFDDGDLIDYDPLTDSAQLIFDGSARFADSSEKVISVHVMANGHLVMSTDSNATLGGLSFNDEDLVEYDPATDTASLFFDGSAASLNADIDALHILDNGQLVLSTVGNASLGGLSFDDGDLIEYDPVADSALLIFDGSELFTDAGEKVISVHVGVGSGGFDLGSRLLLVVPNAASLSAQDSTKRSLMESWGFDVTLISANASQVTYDAAVAGVDVAYISEEVISGDVGNKLRDAAIGVVIEENFLSDEFGIASSNVVYNGSTIELIDTAHYITDGFSPGTLTVTSAATALTRRAGSLAPDLEALAQTGANAELSVVDKGGQLYDLGTASGRRVQLAWGGTDFDVNLLTTDGLTLMRRALEWAAGANLERPPIAHWKLDDASGTTVLDSIGGNDATLNGNPSWTTGVAAGALEFDGSGDYAATDSNFSPPATGSVSFWMKVPGAPASTGRLLGIGNNWEIRHVTGGTGEGVAYGLVFDLGMSGTNNEFVTTVALDSPDQWYFVVATYNSVSDAYAVYLDGALNKAGRSTAGLSSTGAGILSIGTRTGSSEYFTGTLDELRVYDYVLGADQVAELYAANPPPGAASYTQVYQQWSAGVDDSWETVDLSGIGVPPDAVVEVAMTNAGTGNRRWGGVRAVGSSLERRLQLHETEDGGLDMLTMHVQVDGGSQLQHYADDRDDVKFTLLGYWSGAVYVELIDAFTAASSNSWVVENVGDDGLGANQVVEIAMVNINSSAERFAGLRATGSGLQRRFEIHEADGGGVDAVSLMVNTDASATLEIYAESNSDIDFYALGYWSTPPGSYVEGAGLGGQVVTTGVWETTDLSSYGVTADAVAQLVLANDNDSSENNMGAREIGSTHERLLDLQEAKDGGSNLGTLHVNVDAAARLQWYVESDAASRYFYPVGWWNLNP